MTDKPEPMTHDRAVAIITKMAQQSYSSGESSGVGRYGLPGVYISTEYDKMPIGIGDEWTDAIRFLSGKAPEYRGADTSPPIDAVRAALADAVHELRQIQIECEKTHEGQLRAHAALSRIDQATFRGLWRSAEQAERVWAHQSDARPRPEHHTPPIKETP